MFTGIKKLIENYGHQTHHHAVIFAVACSALLHWAIAHWIAIAVSASQRPAMGFPLTVIKAVIAPPQSTPENQNFVTEADAPKTSVSGKVDEEPVEPGIEGIPGPVNLVTNQPKYFDSHEVDVTAVPIYTPPLLFPERAYLSRLSGRVRVRVFISETGTVDSAEAIETNPTHQPFTESAIASVQNTIFSPAVFQGRKVKSQKLIEVIFNAEADQPID